MTRVIGMVKNWYTEERNAALLAVECVRRPRMNFRPKWLLASAALGVLTNLLYADDASAHVKWFCAFDVAGQPRNLENVLCANFELLVGAAILVLVLGCLVE